MKTRQTLITASIIALGLFSFPVLSQAFEGHQSQQSGQHCQRSADKQAKQGWERMAKRLNLSQEQRQSMLSIKDKYQPQLSDKRALISSQRTTLAKLEANAASLPDAAAAQGKSIADMIVLRKQMRGEMEQVLTEEQRQTFSKIMQQRGRHHRHESRRQG